MSAPFNKVFIRSRCCKDDLYEDLAGFRFDVENARSI